MKNPAAQYRRAHWALQKAYKCTQVARQAAKSKGFPYSIQGNRVKRFVTKG
jgi:hypothetical protein